MSYKIILATCPVDITFRIAVMREAVKPVILIYNNVLMFTFNSFKNVLKVLQNPASFIFLSSLLLIDLFKIDT